MYQNRYIISSIRQSEGEESEEEEEESEPISRKIFKISKIQRRNAILLRNKVAKIFWITKYKRDSNGKLTPDNKITNPYYYEESSSVYRNSEKFERYPSLIKRCSNRPNYPSRVETRISNDYSCSAKFKIQRINRNLIKPFALTRYPKVKKGVELDSTSTKRSSRESSKHKISPVLANEVQNTINLIKVEHFDEPEKHEEEYNFMDESLLQLTKNQNEELNKEIQALRLQAQLEEDLDFPQCEDKHANNNFRLEFESMHSYHDNDFEDAYSEYDKHNSRNRGVSG